MGVSIRNYHSAKVGVWVVGGQARLQRFHYQDQYSFFFSLPIPFLYFFRSLFSFSSCSLSCFIFLFVWKRYHSPNQDYYAFPYPAFPILTIPLLFYYSSFPVLFFSFPFPSVSLSLPFGNAIITWFYFLFPALLYLSILFTTLLYLFDSLSPPYCHSYPPHLSFPTLAHSSVLKIGV